MEKEIIELLKSGNFTIAYHDNACPSLYRGKHDYEDLKAKDEVCLDGFDDGYCPNIVILLTEALGGVTDSI